MQLNLALLLRFLVYFHLDFNQSLKHIYSTNHSLLSLFHALTSLLWLFDLASGLSSHLHFRISSTTIPFTYITAYLCTQCLRLSLHKITMVGFCGHFKSPSLISQHHFIIRTLLSLYVSFIPSSCEAIIIIIIIILRNNMEQPHRATARTATSSGHSRHW